MPSSLQTERKDACRKPRRAGCILAETESKCNTSASKFRPLMPKFATLSEIQSIKKQ